MFWTVMEVLLIASTVIISVITTSLIYRLALSPSINYRISVLEQLMSGRKLARDVDLPVSKSRRMCLLTVMLREGLIDYDVRYSDDKYIYKVARPGLRLLGEQDR